MTPVESQPFTPSALDLSTFEQPVVRSELDNQRRHDAEVSRAPLGERAYFVTVFTFAVLAIAVLAGFGIGAVHAMFTSFGLPQYGGAVFLLLLVGGLAHFTIRNFARWLQSTRRSPRRSLRLSRFAARNGLTYSSRETESTLPGSIFHQGASRVTSNRLATVESPSVELGNHRYTDSIELTNRERAWTYIAIEMDRHLPHMVLNARANRRRGSIPGYPDVAQTLSLEGDFDSHFTLSVPRGYERDALYILTPDVMALLVDNTAAFNVEIIDDWVFICAPRFLPLDSPEIVARLGSIIAAIRPKVQRQTSRYRDEREGAQGRVAPAGRRLREKVVMTFAWALLGTLVFLSALLLVANAVIS